MKHKNDYTVIAFFDVDKPRKWTYVHKLRGFVSFLNSKFPNWQYINVYERRSGSFLKRFYPQSTIPDFLQ